jgi:phosphoribosylanthranilate isomerase
MNDNQFDTQGNIMISLVTFTGVDNRTNFTTVRSLAEKYPFIEFGILLSLTPDDKDERYMTIPEINEAVGYLQGNVPLALHICGSAVRHFVLGTDEVVTDLARQFGRVQLNFSASKGDFTADQLSDAMVKMPGKVITQHFPSNSALVDVVTAANHQVLYDTSGGRGLETAEWLAPFPAKVTGYAGGLGPDGIEDSIDAIQAVTGSAPVWIDMESRVRTEGYLDLKKCRVVASAVAERVGVVDAQKVKAILPW